MADLFENAITLDELVDEIAFARARLLEAVLVRDARRRRRHLDSLYKAVKTRAMLRDALLDAVEWRDMAAQEAE